jgi:AraC family transcriptional regulator
LLYRSDYYEIKNWQYDLVNDFKKVEGVNDCLCMVYVHKGVFNFDLSLSEHKMHSGYLVLEKASYEYKMLPSIGECTIFNFTDLFFNKLLDAENRSYNSFLLNEKMMSVVLQSIPEIDFLSLLSDKNMHKSAKPQVNTRMSV